MADDENLRAAAELAKTECPVGTVIAIEGEGEVVVNDFTVPSLLAGIACVLTDTRGELVLPSELVGRLSGINVHEVGGHMRVEVKVGE